MSDQLEHIATARHPGEIWELTWTNPNGQVISRKLGGVHFTEDCQTEHCVLHNPSEHSMRDLPLHWRDDRQIFERICPHGVGHPDPDQFEFWESKGKTTESRHGCDGCCLPEDHPMHFNNINGPLMACGECYGECRGHVSAFGGGPNLTAANDYAGIGIPRVREFFPPEDLPDWVVEPPEDDLGR